MKLSEKEGENRFLSSDFVLHVPKGWSVTKTKHLASFSVGWTPPTGVEESYLGENLWANISDLGPRVLNDTAKKISNDAVTGSRMKVSPIGSLLFSFKLSIGQVSFAGKEMYTNEAIATFLPSPSLDLSFAYYAFPFQLVQNASENIYGAKLLNQELIRSAPLLVPHKQEQIRIATYLDRETAKIDALIEKQQRLIELLEEKRQAVISQAVTKGLDPTVPMKDSGVEWLGKVPAHWTVAPLKFSWSVTDCKHLTAEFVEDGFPLASIREVQSWTVQLEFAKRTTFEFYSQLIEGKRQPQEGDIIFSRNATVGETAKVTEGHPPFAMGQDVCLLRKHSINTSADFLLFVMRSQVISLQLSNCMIGSTFKRVNVEEIKSLQIPVPPHAEQELISIYLIRQIETLDRLAAICNQAIALIKERRAALISAAVTGKIDVREVV